MNVELAVCGFTVVFDEPSVDGRPAERREDYELFPDFFDELPLRVDHHRIITSAGAYNAGTVSRFAVVDGSPPVPYGVLCLAQSDDNDIGRGVHADVASGELWGFSLGGNGRAEVSLTSRPAYTSCRVVGWGATALSAWNLLTGAAPDIPGPGRSLGDLASPVAMVERSDNTTHPPSPTQANDDHGHRK
jgi:hypothetical protein